MKYLKPLELYHEFLKSNSGRLMGLSVGKTEMGVSISEACKKIVSPRPMTVVRTDDNIVSSVLQDLISTFSVSGLVIGYPFFMEEDSRFPNVGVPSKSFVDVLNKTRNFEDMNYTLWESSCTTKMMFHAAKQLVKPYKFIPMDHYAIRDQNAAYEMLRSYFNIVEDPGKGLPGYDEITADFARMYPEGQYDILRQT